MVIRNREDGDEHKTNKYRRVPTPLRSTSPFAELGKWEKGMWEMGGGQIFTVSRDTTWRAHKQKLGSLANNLEAHVTILLIYRPFRHHGNIQCELET